MGEQVRKTEFSVTYGGEAIDNHEIDARVLANSLLGIADAIKAASECLYGDNVEPVVNVKAGFKEGSFIATLVEIVKSEEFQGVATVCGVLGFTAKDGLVPFINTIKGSSLKKKKKNPDGTFDVEGENGVAVKGVKEKILDLYEEGRVRKAIEDSVLMPPQSGVEFIAFCGAEGGEAEVIRSEEMRHFIAPKSDTLKDETRMEYLFPVKINGRGGKSGWSFSDESLRDGEDCDDQGFSATVLDKEFLFEIRSSQIVVKNTDLLRVSMRTVRKKKSAGNVRTDRYILKIHEVVPKETWETDAWDFPGVSETE